MIYPMLLILTDFVALLSAFTLAYILRVQVDASPLTASIGAFEYIKIFIVLFPIWLLINATLGLYTKPVYEKRFPELGRLLIGAFVGILTIIGYDFTQTETIFPARLVPVYGFVLAFILLALLRNLLWIWRRYMFRYGYGVRGVMIIGSSEATRKLAERLKYTLSSGFEIRAIVGNKKVLPKDFKGSQFIKLEDALTQIPKLGIHTVIQTEFYDQEAKNQRIFEAVRDNHLQYKFLPSQSEFYTGKNTVEVLFGFPVISVHQTPLIGWGRVVKRGIDLVLGVIASFLALPIIAAVAIIIKVSDPKGPVFYTQQRMTRFGTSFKVYKLRSMYQRYCISGGDIAAKNIKMFEKMGRKDLVKEYEKYHKVEDDPRIMPIGKFTRASSIDELPQLLNVLKGELSLVGPRPMYKEELQPYREAAGGDVVLSVKSGITGMWQVSGRSDVTLEERVKLDLYYAQNWSLWLDIKILAKTVSVVLLKKGAK